MRSMDLDLLFLDVLIKSTSRHVQVFTIFPSFIMASIKSKPATKNDLDKLEKKLNLKKPFSTAQAIMFLHTGIMPRMS